MGIKNIIFKNIFIFNLSFDLYHPNHWICIENYFLCILNWIFLSHKSLSQNLSFIQKNSQISQIHILIWRIRPKILKLITLQFLAKSYNSAKLKTGRAFSLQQSGRHQEVRPEMKYKRENTTRIRFEDSDLCLDRKCLNSRLRFSNTLNTDIYPSHNDLVEKKFEISYKKSLDCL